MAAFRIHKLKDIGDQAHVEVTLTFGGCNRTSGAVGETYEKAVENAVARCLADTESDWERRCQEAYAEGCEDACCPCCDC